MALAGQLLCPVCGAHCAPDDRFCPVGHPLGADPLLEHVRHALMGEYDVAQEIGRGGMAAVYLARDLRLPRKVALKVMLPELAYAPTMPQRFLGEARTAAALDHPSIVPIYRSGDNDGVLWFAMRYVEGCTLEQMLRAHGALPVELACYLLAEIAGALEYAHEEGVVHRDVKPGNVMLDKRWARAMVTDFGIARVVDGERLTGTGLAIGTPEYMSPEQCTGMPLTGASDQYSLGVLAYQMLTGAAPFAGTQGQVLAAQLRDIPRPLRERRPEIPAVVDNAVLRMLAKDPGARWLTLRELVAALATVRTVSDITMQQTLLRFLPESPTHGSQVITPLSPWAGVPKSVEMPDASPAAAPPSPPTAPVGATPVPPPPSTPLTSPLIAASAPTQPAMAQPPVTQSSVAQPPATVPLPLADAPPAEPTLVDASLDDAAVGDAAFGETEEAPRSARRALAGGVLAGAVVLAAVGSWLALRDRSSGAAAPPAPTPPASVAATPPPPDVAPPVATPPAPVVDTTTVPPPTTSTGEAIAAPAAPLRLVIASATRAKRLLFVGDTLRLRARVTGTPAAAGTAVLPVPAGDTTIRWSSSDTSVLAVRGTLAHARSAGPVTLTVRRGGLAERLALVVAARAEPVKEEPPKRAVATHATPSIEEAGSALEAFVNAIERRQLDEVRRAFDAGGSGPGYGASFVDWIARNKDLKVALEMGNQVRTQDGEPTLGFHLRISTKGGFLRKGSTKNADGIATLAHDDGRWRVRSAVLTQEFKP